MLRINQSFNEINYRKYSTINVLNNNNNYCCTELAQNHNLFFEIPIDYGKINLINSLKTRNNLSFGYNLFLKDIPNLHCAYCSRKMLATEQVNKLAKCIPQLYGKQAVQILTDYSLELNGIEKIVSNILINTAKKNPKKTINEVIVELINEKEVPLIQKQAALLKKIKRQANQLLSRDCYMSLVKVLPEEDVNLLLKVPSSQRGRLLKKKNIIKKMMNLYNVSSERDQQQLEKLIQIARQLPSSTTSHEAFIVKYGKRSSEQFIERLFNPIRSSAEHIFLNKDGAASSMDNLLATCTECNEKRGEQKFDIWLKNNPDVILNLGKYISDVRKVVNNPDFQVKYGVDIVNYPDLILETLDKASYGKFKHLIEKKIKNM